MGEKGYIPGDDSCIIISFTSSITDTNNAVPLRTTILKLTQKYANYDDYYAELPQLARNGEHALPIIYSQVFKKASWSFVRYIRIINVDDYNTIMGTNIDEAANLYFMIISINFEDFVKLSAIIPNTFNNQWNNMKQILTLNDADTIRNTIARFGAIKTQLISDYMTKLSFELHATAWMDMFSAPEKFYMKSTFVSIDCINFDKRLIKWCVDESIPYHVMHLISGDTVITNKDTESLINGRAIQKYDKVAKNPQIITMLGQATTLFDEMNDLRIVDMDRQNNLLEMLSHKIAGTYIVDAAQTNGQNHLYYVQENFILMTSYSNKVINISSNVSLHILSQWKVAIVNEVYNNIKNNKLGIEFVKYQILNKNELSCVFKVYADPHSTTINSWQAIVMAAVNVNKTVLYLKQNLVLSIVPVKLPQDFEQTTVDLLFEAEYNNAVQNFTFSQNIRAVFSGVLSIILGNIVDIGQLLKFAVSFVNDNKQWELLKQAVLAKASRQDNGPNERDITAIKAPIIKLYENYTKNKHDTNFVHQYNKLLSFLNYIVLYLDFINANIHECNEKWYTYGDCVLVLKAKQLSSFFSQTRDSMAKQLLHYFVEQCNTNQLLGCNGKNEVMDKILVPFIQAKHFPITHVHL